MYLKTHFKVKWHRYRVKYHLAISANKLTAEREINLSTNSLKKGLWDMYFNWVRNSRGERSIEITEMSGSYGWSFMRKVLVHVFFASCTLNCFVNLGKILNCL